MKAKNNSKSFRQTLINSDLCSFFLGIYKRYIQIRRGKFGYIHPTAFYRYPILIKGVNNVYLHENTHLLSDCRILALHAKFVMKKNSGAAEGLTVVTGNHVTVPGLWFMDVTDEYKEKHGLKAEYDKDVVVEEDVWIASNVTILMGVTVGRGSVIGAGAVLRNNIPPYAIVAGNPAKVVGFKFTPQEVIEYEKALYPEEERLPLELLEKNYDKYFISKIKEIKSYMRLSM